MGNTMVASIVIHTYVLGNGRKVIQRMALALHVEESELLMATTETTETTVPFLVRGCNPSVNTEELAFQYGITAVLGYIWAWRYVAIHYTLQHTGAGSFSTSLRFHQTDHA